MGRPAARLILALALAASVSGAFAAPPEKRPMGKQIPWTSLKPDERRVLGPIQDRWESFPSYQQQRLISSARRYPSLQPIQKERFDQRLRSWAEMTPEQREAARETYQDLRRLTPAQQHELRERWLQRHQRAEELSEPNFETPPGVGPRERAAPGPVTPDYTRRR